MVTTEQTRVIEQLRHAQANAVVMYLNAKRYHWYTFGPHFRDLHLFFDEVALAAFNEIDPLGERVRTIGGDTVSRPDEIGSVATIRTAGGTQNPRQMLEELLANENTIVREMREGAKMANEEGDAGTESLLGDLVQTHEKHAWFIREFLQQHDGLGN
jgi:starvation-inducible DNA-binding protein